VRQFTSDLSATTCSGVLVGDTLPPPHAADSRTVIGSRQATGVGCGPNRAILGSLVPSTSSGRRVCSHLTPPARGRWLPSGGHYRVSAAWWEGFNEVGLGTGSEDRVGR
jgi:hypothetical protein